MPLLDILIPTYMRAKDLGENLALLEQQAQELHPQSLRIIISDNASTDSTPELIASYQARAKELPWQLVYHRQEENKGLEANAVQVLKLARADYVLFLGDDDYLAEGYLAWLIEQMQSENPPATVLTGLVAINNSGEVLENPRPVSFAEKAGEAGFATLLDFSHLAHQMSGLVLRRAGLLESYLAAPAWRNPYLFIHFAAQSLWRGGGIYAARFQTRIKVLNAKDWSYNNLGLLDEVYKSYYPLLEELGAEQLSELLIHFTRMHSYRLGISWKSPLKLYRQYKQLVQEVPEAMRGHFAPALRLLFFKEYLLIFKPF